jgi:hypothetical protein
VVLKQLSVGRLALVPSRVLLRGNVSLVGQELAVLGISSAERSGKPPFGDATYREST